MILGTFVKLDIIVEGGITSSRNSAMVISEARGAERKYKPHAARRLRDVNERMKEKMRGWMVAAAAPQHPVGLASCRVAFRSAESSSARRLRGHHNEVSF